MTPTGETGTRSTLADGLDADVLIVGYGPVGQSLAGLLGAKGHRVVVLERREGRYNTPRAGHFDHEIMRIFQSMGVADEVSRVAEPAHVYEFLDHDGALVSRLPREWDAPSGWEASYHFYQPELEDVLDAAIQGMPGVELRFGAAVADLQQTDGHVTVTLEDGATLTARYAVGADGANSTVRTKCAIGTDDLGFRGDWLVVDLKPLPSAQPPDIPDTGLVLDPERPNHMGRVGDRYLRWEFMLVDGDDPDEMVEPERAWELLKRWVGPEQAQLIRQTVYQFRSIVAETFRDGSVLLAGDAAHVMPPFLGQGMSSGIRDAATLAWMLDLLLTDAADPTLLDLYTASRRPQVIEFIEESVRIGTVVCETDPTIAAERREAMRSVTELPPPFQPPIGAGFREGDALAGHLGVQPTLANDEGQAQRSDDMFGSGFTLFSLLDLGDDARELAGELRCTIGLRSVVIGLDGVNDPAGALTRWMDAAGVSAVLVRPDFYVFGTAAESGEVSELLNALRLALSLKSRPAEHEVVKSA